jgi:hypothetical protein
MARTFQNLVLDLFRSAATASYDTLKAEVERRDESFHARGVEKNTRAEIITQLVIDAYESVLLDVQNQLDIPAESIGTRTQDDAEDLLAVFLSEAEAVRTRFALKWERFLAGAQGAFKDEYELRTLHIRDKTLKEVRLHVAAVLQMPSAKELDDTWQRLVRVVEGKMTAEAHDIQRNVESDVLRLPPPGQGFHPERIAEMYMKAMRKRVDAIFGIYSSAIVDLKLRMPKELLPLIPVHIDALVDEAVRDYRKLVAERFANEDWEVPEDLVAKAVVAAVASAMADREQFMSGIEYLAQSAAEERARAIRSPEQKQLASLVVGPLAAREREFAHAIDKEMEDLNRRGLLNGGLKNTLAGQKIANLYVAEVPGRVQIYAEATRKLIHSQPRTQERAAELASLFEEEAKSHIAALSQQLDRQDTGECAKVFTNSVPKIIESASADLELTLSPPLADAAPAAAPAAAATDKPKRAFLFEGSKWVAGIVAAVIVAVVVAGVVTRPSADRERRIQNQQAIRDSVTDLLEKVRNAAASLDGRVATFDGTKASYDDGVAEARSYWTVYRALETSREPRTAKLRQFFDSTVAADYDSLRIDAFRFGGVAGRAFGAEKDTTRLRMLRDSSALLRASLSSGISEYERRMLRFKN